MIWPEAFAEANRGSTVRIPALREEGRSETHPINQISGDIASPRHRIEALTPTQLRVLRAVRFGLANKQIAFELGIAEATVKAHMTALMRKLSVRNRTQVAILAEQIEREPLYN
jgi:DNA-binding NarL/FixJ family response regulator